MSERHRQTQRVRHYAARHTMKAPRLQVGGDRDTWYYHIEDPMRAAAWNAALSANTDLKRFATVITTPGWEKDSTGPITDSQRLKLYVELIERQDEMFRVALSIIYGKLDLDPASDTLEDEIHEKIDDIATKELTLKEYLKDVVKLIVGIPPNNNYGALFTYSTTTLKEEKISRLLNDPLSQILLWPERVSNLLVEYIARILIDLKEKKISNIKAGSGESYKIQNNLQISTFCNKCNSFIQSNALALTYTGLRDGFYIWHETADAVVPQNICPTTPCYHLTKGAPNNSIIKEFWESFCEFLDKPDSSYLNDFKRDMANITFAQLTAYIYKLYLNNNYIDIVRSKILDLNTFQLKTDKKKITTVATSSYRRPPKSLLLLTGSETLEGKQLAQLLCALDPSQYSYILHLLYTIKSIEEEEEASKASVAPPSI